MYLDTEEGSVYEAGGVLQRFAQDFLEGQVAWCFVCN